MTYTSLSICFCGIYACKHTCVKTKKPAITNDVIDDPRIRYPEWAKKKLNSYAGYPLFYKGEAIAVLVMFSEKKLSPADFEILGVFSDELLQQNS